MNEEVRIFLYSCLTGLLIMLFYDIFSVVRKKKCCSLLLINVCDGMFIITACALMMFINMTVSNGIVRGYEFCGAFLGAIIYKLILCRPISFLLTKIIAFITTVFQLFFKIVLTPIQFMYKMIYKCMVVLVRPVRFLLRRLFSHTSHKVKTSVKTVQKALKKT